MKFYRDFNLGILESRNSIKLLGSFLFGFSKFFGIQTAPSYSAVDVIYSIYKQNKKLTKKNFRCPKKRWACMEKTNGVGIPHLTEDWLMRILRWIW